MVAPFPIHITTVSILCSLSFNLFNSYPVQPNRFKFFDGCIVIASLKRSTWSMFKNFKTNPNSTLTLVEHLSSLKTYCIFSFTLRELKTPCRQFLNSESIRNSWHACSSAWSSVLSESFKKESTSWFDAFLWTPCRLPLCCRKATKPENYFNTVVYKGKRQRVLLLCSLAARQLQSFFFLGVCSQIGTQNAV